MDLPRLTEENIDSLKAAIPAGYELIKSATADRSVDALAPNATGDYIDVGTLARQEFGNAGFGAGGTLRGAAAGASFGLPGAIAGGVIGLGSDIVSFLNKQSAKRRFEKEKSGNIRDAVRYNNGVRTAERMQEMSAFSTTNQIRDFYG